MPATGVLLLFFLLCIQTLLITERFYNATLCLIVGVEKSPTSLYSTKQALAQGIAFFASVFYRCHTNSCRLTGHDGKKPSGF